MEHPAYQAAVETALRDNAGEFRRYADPRTNDYGNLINDGGHTVPGRSNNCLDCSLSALSSFRGDPTVSAPRYPDLLPNGGVDTRSGERSGLQRAYDWLGDPVAPVSPGLPMADRFAELHQRISDMGPVVQRWWSTSGTREISEPVSRCMTLTVGRSSKALMRQLWFIRTVHQGRFGGIRKCGPCPISHRRR